MPLLQRTLRRLSRLTRRSQLDRDLDDELRFHQEMMRGTAVENRRQFGNATALREACRDSWTLGSLEIWWQDVRYAARALAGSPGFAFAAIATMALGIGINATVFTLANAVLFKNQPFPNSDRILYLMSREHGTPDGISYPDYRDFRAQAKSFVDLGASERCNADLADGAGLPQSYRCAKLTTNAFGVIAQTPVAGRDFTETDGRPGAEAVAILSYGVWQSRYGGSTSIVGTLIRINAVPTRVIGVMARGVRFPGDADIWLPMVIGGSLEERTYRALTVFGRLAPGVSSPAATAELHGIAARLATAYPETNRDVTAEVRTFNQTMVPKVRTIFLAMLGAVGFVLLIACSNVANLLLGRGVGRAREISIRLALGAGSIRILRQLLVEAVMLSVTGGAIGCVLAIWGARAFDAAITPTGKPAWIDFSMDLRVLAYVTAVSIGTGIVFGFVPALRLLRADLTTSLKDGGRTAGPASAPRRLSSALVVVEMALAVVLLAGAGLLVRSALKLYAAPLGVDTANVLTFRVNLPRAKYRTAADQSAFFARLEAELSSVPGVQDVTIARQLPAGGSSSFEYELDGSPQVRDSRRPHTLGVVVGPHYFETLRAPVTTGRAFLPTDTAAAPGVVLVNRGFAIQAWPGADAIGRRLRLVQNKTAGPWLTVAGVAPDILQESAQNPETADATHSRPMIYLPYAQQPGSGMFVAVRTAGAPAVLADPLRRAVQALDRDLPVAEVMTLDEAIALTRWPIRVFGTMFAIFAAAALLLASVGLYAVVAQSVRRRSYEIGIRVALGARSTAVLKLVLAQGARQLAAGLAIGLAGALAATRVLGGLLVGVSPTDPLTLAAVVLSLVAAGAAGLWLPARRALAVDPAVTLRHD